MPARRRPRRGPGMALAAALACAAGVDGVVVLVGGRVFCEPSGARVDQPQAGDVRLTTTWEWGRTILEFNPDIQGFERERS